MHGSPPRVWGKLQNSSRKRMFHPVHPHVCGENSQSGAVSHPQFRFTPTCVGKTGLEHSLTRKVYGSPPRVWGKRDNTDTRDTDPSVHPHVCGENFVSLAQTMSITRFTPTCVGKTVQCRRNRDATTVHPHVCGENWWALVARQKGVRFTPTCVGKTWYAGYTKIAKGGSPPRVWGKPASRTTLYSLIPVHPHVCGEN